MQPQPKTPIHRRPRSHLRCHDAPQVLSNRDHPVLKSNELHTGLHQNANAHFHQDVNHRIHQVLHRVNNNIQETTRNHQNDGTAAIMRKHTAGRQRATIYFDQRPFRAIASSNRCSLRTIHKIKSCPLSVIGLNWRQMKVILSDIQDSNLMNWFTSMNGIGDMVLPPVDFVHRSGAQCMFSTYHISVLRFILTHNPDLYLDKIKY